MSYNNKFIYNIMNILDLFKQTKNFDMLTGII